MPSPPGPPTAGPAAAAGLCGAKMRRRDLTKAEMRESDRRAQAGPVRAAGQPAARFRGPAVRCVLGNPSFDPADFVCTVIKICWGDFLSAAWIASLFDAFAILKVAAAATAAGKATATAAAAAATEAEAAAVAAAASGRRGDNPARSR